MKVEVKLFSILRDCLPAGARQGQAVIELPEPATLRDLITHLGIDQKLGYSPQDIIARAGWQVIVNGSFEASLERRLQAEDYVQIFPPVAGG
ncbi:MAG: MoaD/ThiS family protein [Chloroflexota bacterium]